MTKLYLRRTSRTWQRGFVRMGLLTLISLTAACQLLESRGSALTVSAERIQSSEIDQRAYRALDLDNGLRVLLISDPDTDKAAAAMDVGVGSGSDPLDRQGMAHFLEHMLFLGTSKYPTAGEYQSFINQHGGSHNAFTAYDHTNYFFDIDADYLEPALDRFAQQFVAPLFSADYVERERNAVHSEYTSKLKDDGRRFFAVLRQAMDPEHPMSRFSVGNLNTLGDTPGASVREDLLAFYETHYSSHIMRLVVYGQEPLEQLEGWVRDRFSSVPRRDLAQETHAEQPLFPPARLPLLLTTVPVKEKRSLSLLFTMPAVEPHYRTKPLHYISHLIGHEGQGSLLSWLKRQDLAEGLSAGLFSSDDREAIFSISVQLTPQGRRDYQQVIDATFAYIALLQSSPVEEWRFHEQQVMLETAFRFQDKAAPIHYVSALANRLHDHSPAEVLVAPYLMDRFDAALIRQYLERLNRDALVAVLVAPDAEVDRSEPWYSATYGLQPLPPSGAANPEVSGHLRLPEANPFIPSDLELLSGTTMRVPARLQDTGSVEAWHAQDLSFNSPKASYYLSLRTPVTNASPRDVVLTELFVSMAREQLTEYAYPAFLAGLEFKLYKHQRGLTLRIDGFSEKQPELLSQILETLAEFDADPVLFDRFRQEMHRDLRNNLQNKPFERLATQSRQLLLHPNWSEEQQLQALETLTLADLEAFVPRLWEAMKVVTLAMGNLSAAQAQRANAVVEQRLLAGRTAADVPKSRVIQLSDAVAFKEIQTSHSDSAYLLYVQGAGKSFQDRAVMGLISQIISPSYYHQIRTEAQMGYVVFATPFTMMEVPGIAFIVQSPSHTPAQIDAGTRAFLQHFQDELQDMPEDDFNRHKEALVIRLLETDKTLEQRADRFWTEIDISNPDFDTTERIAAVVRSLTREQLLAAYRTLFLDETRSLLLVAVPESGKGQWAPSEARAVRDREDLLSTNSLFPAEASINPPE